MKALRGNKTQERGNLKTVIRCSPNPEGYRGCITSAALEGDFCYSGATKPSAEQILDIITSVTLKSSSQEGKCQIGENNNPCKTCNLSAVCLPHRTFTRQ